MLHAAYPCEKSSLIYRALVFPPDLPGANSSDRCTTEYIRPVINGNIEIHIPIGPDFKDYPRLKSSMEEIFSCAFQNNPSLDLLLKSELPGTLRLPAGTAISPILIDSLKNWRGALPGSTDIKLGNHNSLYTKSFPALYLTAVSCIV